MSYIQLRIDEKDKEEARKVLDKLGLDMSSGIKLFLRQVVIKQGLPFAVDRDSELDFPRKTDNSSRPKEVKSRQEDEIDMSLEDFKKSREYLFWDVHLDSLNEEAVVERILNYGDWDDVQLMFRIIGIKRVAEIFYKQVSRPRNNYRGQIRNYYKMYFEKYA